MTLRYDSRSRVSTYTQSWVSSADPDFGAFESIATTTLSTATATVTFSSIPQTYKHLQIRTIARTNRSANQDFLLMQYNSDTASNYSYHQLYGDGDSAGSASGVTQTSMQTGSTAGATAIASVFGVAVIDILDYTNTNKYKTSRSLDGMDRNGAGYVQLWSGSWRSTSAITTVTITSYGAANFIANSQFALYGIKG